MTKSELDAEFDQKWAVCKEKWAEITRQREKHQVMMRPNMQHDMLEDLKKREEERGNLVKEYFETTKTELEANSKSYLERFNTRLEHYTDLFLTVFDTTPKTEDIKKEFEEVSDKRKSLSQLVENYQIQEALKA